LNRAVPREKQKTGPAATRAVKRYLSCENQGEKRKKVFGRGGVAEAIMIVVHLGHEGIPEWPWGFAVQTEVEENAADPLKEGENQSVKI